MHAAVYLSFLFAALFGLAAGHLPDTWRHSSLRRSQPGCSASAVCWRPRDDRVADVVPHARRRPRRRGDSRRHSCRCAAAPAPQHSLWRAGLLIALLLATTAALAEATHDTERLFEHAIYAYQTGQR